MQNSNHISDWEKIVNSADAKASLVDHFKFLVKSADALIVLNQLMDKMEKVEISGDSLDITFEGDFLMSCYPPSSIVPATNVPKSYADIMKVHSRIDLEGSDVPLTYIGLFDNGELYTSEMVDEAEDFISLLEEKNLDIDDVMLALYYHQDEMIFNPLVKTDKKEPAVCYLSHEDCEVREPLSTDREFSEVFLMLLAQDVLEMDFFEIS